MISMCTPAWIGMERPVGKFAAAGHSRTPWHMVAIPTRTIGYQHIGQEDTRWLDRAASQRHWQERNGVGTERILRENINEESRSGRATPAIHACRALETHTKSSTSTRSGATMNRVDAGKDRCLNQGHPEEQEPEKNTRHG